MPQNETPQIKCRNCRFWRQEKGYPYTELSQQYPEFGVCNLPQDIFIAPGLPNMSAMIPYGEGTEMEGVLTHQDFGCMKWESTILAEGERHFIIAEDQSDAPK